MANDINPGSGTRVVAMLVQIGEHLGKQYDFKG